MRFSLVSDAAAAEFDDLLSAALPGVEADEPGTLVYLVHRVADPLERVVTAVYADAAAHETHNARPGMAALLARLPELTSSVLVEEHSSVTGFAHLPAKELV
ncbi:quinol monooxygenase YgiN [Motilibacter peucedani]|uniref:Quinol monooxygenase YgiN n=1 Tax=Motilibacter peucedani TaxID=598650 RepID=A0A420XRG3_9ACTN|nr:quinol monooxygenase YgiN [Motilibacter peucedani]